MSSLSTLSTLNSSLSSLSFSSISTPDDLLRYSKSKPSILLVLDFSAEWCGPCKQMKPIFENLKSSYSNVEFHVIDVDDDTRSTIIEKFNIKSIPTIIFYKDGLNQLVLNGVVTNIESYVKKFM